MRQQPNTLFAAFLALALVLALAGCASDAGVGEIADSGSIAIPGFESLTFTAGKAKQSVSLYNPKENACYFRLSLVLEDGETLWTSDDLGPGKSVKTLTLSRPLEAGEYPATLKYDCFTLQENTPLNGAEIQLTIEVH